VTAPRHDRMIGQILGDLGLDPQRLAGRGLQRATERVAQYEATAEAQGRALAELDVRDLVARQIRYAVATLMPGENPTTALLDRATAIANGDAPLVVDGFSS
jgi:hypothetical protein